MPELSRFYGIVIAMYHDDHVPPHFHAEYGEYEARFSIPGLRIIEGSVPPRVRSLVLEWAAQHLQELADDWELCHSNRPPKPIKPLK